MGPLVKLFMALLDYRLTQISESKALRAPTQAGFRPKHSLEDLVLVVQTVVQHAIISKQQLCLCFVDLAKAYDSIPRSQLWEVLSLELNIPEYLV